MRIEVLAGFAHGKKNYFPLIKNENEGEKKNYPDIVENTVLNT